MATFLLHPVSTSEDNEEGLGSEKGGFCKDAELERIDHSGRSPPPLARSLSTFWPENVLN